MYGVFRKLKCVVIPIFHFGFQQPLLKSSFSVLSYTAQNIFVSVGTVLKKPELLGPSRDAQNVCAVAKGSTVLTFVYIFDPRAYRLDCATGNSSGFENGLFSVEIRPKAYSLHITILLTTHCSENLTEY